MLAYSTATPTVAQKNRDEVARMLAAARVAKEREARDARIERLAAKIDADLTAEAPDATMVGAKIITGWAKYRTRFPRNKAPHLIAWHLVDGDDIEYWPFVG